MDQIHPIVRRRNTATIVIRCIALVLILIGAFSVLYSVGRGLQTGGNWRSMRAIYDWPAWLGLALATLVPGIGLVILDRRLARWLVPTPRHACPRCEYDLNRSEASRCPECGYNLAA